MNHIERVVHTWLLLLLASNLHAANFNLAKNSSFTLQGVTSFTDHNGQTLSLKAEWAEISKTLNSQRLYSPVIEIKSSSQRIKATAKEARFKENEIIFVGATEITIVKESSNKMPLTMKSETEPIIMDINQNTLRGSQSTLQILKSLYRGGGFSLNLATEEMTWIGSWSGVSTLKTLKTPYTFKPFKKAP